MAVELILSMNERGNVKTLQIEPNSIRLIPDYFAMAPSLIAVEAFSESDGTIVAMIHKRFGELGLRLYEQSNDIDVSPQLASLFSTRSRNVPLYRNEVIRDEVFPDSTDLLASCMMTLRHVPEDDRSPDWEPNTQDLIADAIRAQTIPFTKEQTLN